MSDTERITVVIADDHPIVLQGLRDIVLQAPDLILAGEARDGAEAMEQIKQLPPHVLVSDIAMPHMSGIELARRIRELHLPTSVILLTVYDSMELFETAMGLDVRGYMLKDSAAADITRAIRSVAGGDCFITAALAADWTSRRRDHGLPRGHGTTAGLSERERTILRMIAEDKSTREIADLLFISPKTVNRHRENISTKLQLCGPLSLCRYAIEHRNLL